MTRDSIEIMLDAFIAAAFNIGAVYVAAFVYQLNWMGVMFVMVVAALITAILTRIFVSKIMATKQAPGMAMNEAVGALLIALIGGIAVFLMLINRFDLPSALGISLLSGLLTSLIRHLLA